jgi:hypothetical protein
VEIGLKSNPISINVQNEMIRDVCSAILNYTAHPSKSEIIHIAKIIIKKYPGMADKKILDWATEWVWYFFNSNCSINKYYSS